jgi:hypothetical protein
VYVWIHGGFDKIRRDIVILLNLSSIKTCTLFRFIEYIIVYVWIHDGFDKTRRTLYYNFIEASVAFAKPYDTS